MTCICDLPISAARSLFKFFVYFNFSEVSHPLLNLFDTVFLKDPYLVPFFTLFILHWFATLLISTTSQFLSILTIPMVRFAGLRQLPSKSRFSSLSGFIDETKNWMTTNKLKLNEAKKDSLLVSPTPHVYNR